MVLAVFVGLALLNAPGGYLGTDTGAKVATLEAMTERGSLRPDLGYWAEDVDPDGDYHPVYDTNPVDDGQWVHVTTLPMLIASQPLYDAGGYRAALLLPMLGVVLAAFAAADLARQLGGERAARRTFWIVALASPLTVYALDFWEHAPGAGLMLLAVAALTRVVGGDPRAVLPLLAGGALGLAVTMRNEAIVVTAVAVAAACAWVLRSHGAGRALRTGATAVVGFAVPWLANAALESWAGGNSRAERAAGQATRDVLGEVGDRAGEAAVTWFGTTVADDAASVAVGASVVAGLAAAVVLWRRDRERYAVAATLAAGVVALLLVAEGPGFVSGALVASPLAVAALATRALDRRRAYLLGTALAATVLTWAFQTTGGAGPQWGGRYLLLPTLLLTVLGIVALAELPRWLASSFVGLAVLMTAFGAVWLHERSHDVDAFFDDLADRPEDVLVSTNGFLLREGGAALLGEPWLSIGRDGDLAGAMRVAEDTGADDVAVLTTDADPPARSGPAAHDATSTLDLFGFPVYLHRYVVDHGDEA